jgi:hypothetical protein
MLSWTVLVYLDGDNNLEGAGVADVNEMETVGSTANVNVVVQFDRISGYDSTSGNWTDTRRARIIQDANTGTIASNFVTIGEANMGDPNTLRDFIQWGVANYPADHYLLDLWDHGGGLDGVCWDDSNGSANLSVSEVRQAIVAAGVHIDVIGFDCCLMAMEEMAHQIRDRGDVMVASEETIPGDGWAYGPFLADLVANPSMTAAQLGNSIVQRYGEKYGNSQTLSNLNLATEPTLATQLNAFATAALDCAEWATITAARNATPYFTDSTFRDLGRFLQYVGTNATDSTLRAAANTAHATYVSAILANHSGTAEAGTGMTIYLPAQGGSIRSDYTSANFLFAADTQWDEFLTAFVTNAPPLRFQVSTSVPANGTAVATAPQDYTINFNYPYNPDSVQPGDLTVNGRTADSRVLADADTVVFHYNTAPMAVPGNYSMSIPAGAITRQTNGEGMTAWTASFRLGVPDIDVQPTSLDAWARQGGTATRALDVGNTGNWDLQWSSSTNLGTFNYVDSDHSAGTPYSWIDISTTGTAIAGLGNDTNVGPFNIGFNFSFYGQGFSTFRVSSNGLLSFTDASAAAANTALPNASAPKNIVAFLWDDLDFAAGGSAYYKLTDAGTLVVEFLNVPFAANTSKLATCEAILKSDGTIKFQYQRVDINNSATVGVQNATGTAGYQVCYNNTFLHNDLAVQLTSAGYALSDSDHAGGPTYSWVDITTTGTAITGLGDDTNVGPFNIGFSFPFYGQSFSSFRVCSNGFLSFTSTSTAYSNTALPSTSAPVNLVAFLWDDLDFRTSGSAYYKQTDANTLVVEFVNAPVYGSPGSLATCEVILKSDGTIKLQYQRVDSQGSGATVGIQNSTGSNGVQFSYNTASLHANLAVQFSSANYTSTDSDHLSGIDYSWVDISTTGTAITGLGDDTNVGPFNIGFNFPFYGQSFSSFRVCSNGFLSFTSTSDAYSNTSLPSASAPMNLVAFLWDDLNFNSGGAAYYKQTDANTLVVEFLNVPLYGSSGSLATCEVILKSDGTIKMQYQRVDHQGGGATVGVQNSTGSSGLQFSYNSSVLHANLAVQFSRSNAWLTLAPNSGTVGPGQITHTAATFNAAGMSAGDYSAVLTIASNDPDEPTVQVPVTFHVRELPLLTVHIVPSATTEGMGLLGAVGTVTIDEAPAAALTVTLQSSRPSELQPVPTTVTIPAGGTTSNPFGIYVDDDALLDGPQTVTVSASAPGCIDGSDSVLVLDNETATLSVTLPAGVDEGGSATGRVDVSTAPSSDVIVSLTSSAAGLLGVALPVTIRAG